MEKLIMADTELETLNNRVRARVAKFRTEVEILFELPRDERRKVARAVRASHPYTLRGREYKLGKPWCENIPDTEEVTVIDIFYVPVDVSKVDIYVYKIVQALKRPGKTLHTVNKELDSLRRQLHADILGSAGFDPMEISQPAMAFKWALEGHVQREVGKLMGIEWMDWSG
jgi:hypothetical protein